jgi:hypothetical protein
MIFTKPIHLTKGEITDAAIKELSFKGFNVWRQNNLAVKGRKFTGMKGLSDIQGYQRSTGKALYCEVKTINDFFSSEQKEFLSNAVNAGCIVLVARQTKKVDFEIVFYKNFEPINF